MNATSSTRLSLKGGGGEEVEAARAHWSISKVIRLKCLQRLTCCAEHTQGRWAGPSHAVVLMQRLRKHRANPGTFEFFFDKVWVGDSADAAHHEHLSMRDEVEIRNDSETTE